MMMLVLGGCKKEDQIRDDITYTLNEIRSNRFSNGAYIYDFESEDNNSSALLSEEEINIKFLSQIDYKIEKLSKDSDNTHGEAVITFTFPDLLTTIVEASEYLENDTNKEALLSLISEKLNGNYKTKEQKVKLDIVYKQSHWYIIPNSELSNVLSGGLLDYYSSLGKKYIQTKSEEESQ